MIKFNYETNFLLKKEMEIQRWLENCIASYGFKVDELNYIFCDDDYLLKLNIEFLNHDTLTDIISFDYSMGKKIGGDIFISVERVVENAKKFSQTIDNEMNRLLIHGVLHFMGFKDKSDTEKELMRLEEDRCLDNFKT